MKKLLMCAVFLFSALYVSAQTEAKEEYLTSPSENWFLSVGGGAEFRLFQNSLKPAFDLTTGARFNFSAGKWFNPNVGFRMTYAYTTMNVDGTSSNNSFITGSATSAKGSIHSLGGDIMLNLSNLIGGYREDRFYTAKPFAGLEANYSHANGAFKDGLFEYMPVIGINNEFYLSKSFSLYLEVAAGATTVNNYGKTAYRPLVFPVRTTIGLTYFLGKGKSRSFRKAVSADSYAALLAANEALNSDLDKSKREASALARDKDALQRELDELRARKKDKVVEKEVEVTPVATFFKINDSTVSKADVARLKYVAEIIKEQPNETFTVEGYADSSTGTKEYNQQLSQKRADAVCKVLVDTYGVKSSQLEPVGKGAVNDLFDDITLNRAVITKSK